MNYIKLESDVQSLLEHWGSVLLSPHWRFLVRVVSHEDMPPVKSGFMGDPLMSVDVQAGEQVAFVTVDMDVDWEDEHFDMELTVVHELLHALFDTLGLEAALEDVVSDLGTVMPLLGAQHSKQVQRTLETVIDRIAAILIRGEREI